jgi:hypothetical protein
VGRVGEVRASDDPPPRIVEWVLLQRFRKISRTNCSKQPHLELFVAEWIVQRPKAQTAEWCAARLCNCVGTKQFNMHPIDFVSTRLLRGFWLHALIVLLLTPFLGC